MSESSSSEDENMERLKEAVWHFGPQGVNGKEGEKGSGSLRTDVSKHEHDGNELGTTPEFRSHVAKKLGTFLDGCISEVLSKPVDLKHVPPENRDEEEEGFLLFSTSTPGTCVEQLPLPAPRRRPVPSSSDSDSEEELRLREAAVSVSDLLGPSVKPSTEKAQVEPVKEDTITKKKKKKKKRKTEGSEEKIVTASEEQSNGEGTEEQTTVVVKLTKKKKKKKIKDNGKDCGE